MGLEFRFIDKEFTAWAGMGLMKRMHDRIDFSSALEACELPRQKSNRRYSPNQLIVQFMVSVWCGANRFEHSEVTRHDPVLQKLFGFDRMVNFKAITRLFRKFDQATTTPVSGRLYRWFLGNLNIDHLMPDLDSTV
ncbi:transposase [Nitrosomonas marina]|uniref:Transposase DDE domain group 1 n=1 Tax=Nitrosomonas marina TaxID=917 RepID=A0A1H8CS61_9PROT|nr:transposase [Nitrosomonas marina]SEM97168.1 Transposase DDE domain group 1 [Nitrosomonas marina]